MDKHTKISIVTVVYNGGTLLESTISNVIDQTYPNLEYIVVDGGSTDETVNIIKKYADKISLWISESDKGIYDAMNKGIKMATGEWILFMNCGDTFCSKTTVAEVALFLTANVNIVYGNTKLNFGNRQILEVADDFSTIVFDIPFCHQSVFVSASLMKENNFDLSYQFSADYDLFLKLYKKKEYRYKRINIPISVYDMFGVSSGLGNLKEYYAIAKKYYPNTWATFKHYMRLKYYLYQQKIKDFLPENLVNLIKDYRKKAQLSKRDSAR